MKKLPAQTKSGFTPIIIILLVVVTVGISYIGYRFFSAKSQTSQPQQVIPGKKLPNASVEPRSKAPGIITQVVASKGIDQKTGEAVGTTSLFSKTDKAIYIVLTLKNPNVGTRFEYTRYLDGKFLDNGSLEMTKAATNNVSFNWALKKPGAFYLAGDYLVKVYTDGVFENEINYKVQ